MTAAGSNWAHARKTPSLCQLVSREEVAQLEARGFFCVGAVNGVVLNVGRPLLADRAFGGLGWVGSPHQGAQIGDRIFLLQGKHYDRPARHEVGQRVEKWTAGMHGVELLGLVLGNLQHLHGENAETVLLELFDDVADRVLADGVGFNDGKCALQCFHSVVGPQSLGLGCWVLGLVPTRVVAPAYYTLTPTAAARVSPIVAGDFATRIPQLSSALIFSAAVPFPPEMIAPACPMRRPGGAVCPAMNPTTGFFMCVFTNSAAVSSALPPISPIMITASVSGSRLKRSSASTNVVPIMGSPPMPMAVDCPMPRCVSWWTAS